MGRISAFLAPIADSGAAKVRGKRRRRHPRPCSSQRSVGSAQSLPALDGALAGDPEILEQGGEIMATLKAYLKKSPVGESRCGRLTDDR